jgi:hypothetical protein
VQKSIENDGNSKNENNDKDLENEKHDRENSNKIINIDNVNWKKVSFNKALYKVNRQPKENSFASYNYFSPLDNTRTDNKGKTEKNRKDDNY